MGAIVSTSSGLIEGGIENGVHAFRGIPYAASTDGANRFRAPQPVASWDGVRNGTKNGLISHQPPLPPPFGQPLPPAGDDCLNLNVWTPDPGASNLPVFVWIHGGAFVGGSSIEPVYDGASFARNSVVCVTINYRLGAQGFWNLADHFPEFPDSGNLGLLDQIAALEWVQKNISSFGGDPGKVTIGGESAGGMSVGSLLAAPKAKGLFRQAIPQSGAGHNGISAPTASKIAKNLLDRVGVKPGDSAALAKLDPVVLLAAQVEMTTEIQTLRNPEVFGEAAIASMALQPTYFTDVLPHRPIDAVRAGSATGIPLLIGTTLEESLVFVVAMAEMFSDNLVNGMAVASFGDAQKAENALKMYRSNRPDAPPHVISAAFDTDRMFTVPAVRLAEAQLAHTKDVWSYRFDWRTPLLGGALGACHALELAFVFNTVTDPAAAFLTGPDAPQGLADDVHQAWVSFISHGNPHHVRLPAWDRYDMSTRTTMLFDTKCSAALNPRAEELALWDGII
ncbi:MAG: Carboxylesterase [Actinomycetota bacterium]